MSDPDAGKMPTIPTWDRRMDTHPHYIAQLGAVVDCYDYGNAMHQTEMTTNCPMKAQYLAITNRTASPELESE